MTAATVAATNQHTDVMDILELKAPQTNLPIEDFEVRTVIAGNNSIIL